MTSQTYAKSCLDSRMHEAIEPQTRSEKNGVAMRFGITRRFGLRIPASEAAGAAARREHRVGPPDADDPLAPWGRLFPPQVGDQTDGCDWKCGCAPHKLWTGYCTLQPIHFAENPALFDAPFLQRHPGALAQDSLGRASAVFRSQGVLNQFTGGPASS
jgi:hypothetical protein